MKLETERLLVRTVRPEDAEFLYRLSYDPQVLEYCPDLFDRDPDMRHIEEKIADFLEYEKNGDVDSWRVYMMEKKDTGESVGVITFSKNNMLHEPEMGWMVIGEHTKKGYASEAAAVFAEFFCEEYAKEYIIAVMDTDNPASKRTAEKAGFRLFEKRTVYDYSVERYCDDYYYLRRYRSGCTLKERFYGDVPYTGR